MVVASVALAAFSPLPVRADAVVGTGAASSCTESALHVAITGGGTITFNCGAEPVTITVMSVQSINTNTSIDGGGLITISGHGTQVFSVSSGTHTLTIANLAVSNRSGYDAAISNSGALTATNCTFSGNRDLGGDGGAIHNGGTLTVTNSTFSGNSTSDYGGGAIYNAGTAIVTNSAFTGNNSGAIYNASGTLIVTNSTFSGNRAGNYGGGGIYNAYGTLTVTNSTFSGNYGEGGAISSAGTLTVTNCTFSGNHADGDLGGYGGAIFNRGTLTVTNSTFSANSAAGVGGAIYNLHTRNVASLTNTIVANSVSGGNCVGPIVDGGHNLDSDGTCGVGYPSW